MKFHGRPYSGNPGYQIMISAVTKHFFYPKLKKNIALFIVKCQECHLVKAEHQHPSGLLQPLPIPKWKWEVISMDVIIGIPKGNKHNDSIFVVVDKLSKATHFIPVKSACKVVHIAEIFLKDIFRLHGIPKEIISNQDMKFTGNFWRSLFFSLETQLNFSTAYHLQMDG